MDQIDRVVRMQRKTKSQQIHVSSFIETYQNMLNGTTE